MATLGTELAESHIILLGMVDVFFGRGWSLVLRSWHALQLVLDRCDAGGLGDVSYGLVIQLEATVTGIQMLGS